MRFLRGTTEPSASRSLHRRMRRQAVVNPRRSVKSRDIVGFIDSIVVRYKDGSVEPFGPAKGFSGTPRMTT